MCEKSWDFCSGIETNFLERLVSESLNHQIPIVLFILMETYSLKVDLMTKCDLCSNESKILYTVKNPKSSEDENVLHLCRDCLKIVHETYVQVK